MASIALSPETSVFPDRTRWSRVAAAAFIVGALDAPFAAFYYNVSLVRIFRSIASALIGKPAAADGGAWVVLLGILIHFLVATGWTVGFSLVPARWAWVRRATARIGPRIGVAVAYGAMMWLIMDLVVLPLTKSTPAAIGAPNFNAMLIWHALALGPPIVFLTRRAA